MLLTLCGHSLVAEQMSTPQWLRLLGGLLRGGSRRLAVVVLRILRSVLPLVRPDGSAKLQRQQARSRARRRRAPRNLARGWAAGPYTEEQLDSLLGPCWVGAKRFAIRQGSPGGQWINQN